MQYGTITHFATAGADKVVTTKAAILHRIIIGADVASGDVEVSDHPSDGDANVVLQVTGSTLMTSNGVIEVNAHFHKGITLDLTNQTKVTVIWSPTA